MQVFLESLFNRPKAIFTVAWGKRSAAPGNACEFDRLAEGHSHVRLATQVNMAFGQNMCCGPDFLGFHPRLR